MTTRLASVVRKRIGSRSLDEEAMVFKFHLGFCYIYLEACTRFTGVKGGYQLVIGVFYLVT